MNITIHGKKEAVERTELKYATAFFAQYLMGIRLAKGLSINVIFRKERSDINGMCMPVDFFERRPKNFIISLRPGMSRNKIMEVLAHEMVHVKQYAKAELVTGANSATFNGKSYKISSSIEDYYNAPWEVEAFGREKSLYLFYRVAVKDEKITFKRGRVYMDGKLLRVPKKG